LTEKHLGRQTTACQQPARNGSDPMPHAAGSAVRIRLYRLVDE